MTEQLELLPTSTPAASGVCNTLDNLTLHCLCFDCGNDTAFVECGYYNQLRCRKCKSHRKLLSKTAVEFLIVCDIAIKSGTPIEAIRAACNNVRHGPLNVALKLLTGRARGPA
jgi:hypothetical protein